MKNENQPTYEDEIEAYFFKYLKIIGFSFILPIWITTIINEGVGIWKIIEWFQNGIIFWDVKPFLSLTLIIFLIPIIYIIWFYYLTIKKILYAVHYDFFIEWNFELAQFFSEKLIKYSSEGKNGNFDLDEIIFWMNEKIEKLPKWLKWITKRLFDQIPILEFVNMYDAKDLERNDLEKITIDINDKINEFQLSLIDSIVPFWTNFIIPVNILLLIFYFKM